jgi:hypothetical protein
MAETRNETRQRIGKKLMIIPSSYRASRKSGVVGNIEILKELLQDSFYITTIHGNAKAENSLPVPENSVDCLRCD